MPPIETETELISIDPTHPEAAIIERAAAVIRAGGLVAFPTETVYGLGADALNPAAVRRIFAAKGRPAEDPIIVHVASPADLRLVARAVPPLAATLAGRFWPGPLTLVLPRADLVPAEITAGGGTVAVRCPAHPVARALIAAAGTPIGAPSANRFSHTSPTAARHVWEDLHGRIELILDGGPTPVGVESTVLDLTRTPPVLLRPGGVSREELEAVIGPLGLPDEVEDSPAAAPLPSPGLLDRHYAPRTPLWLVTGPDEAIRRRLRREHESAAGRGERIALLIAAEDRPFVVDFPGVVGVAGRLADLESVARDLYRVIRELDAAGVDRILAREFPPAGLGLAIRDRLRRAAERVLEAGEPGQPGA